MNRAVLDVNVIVSGFPASSGVPGKLIERWLHREFELVLSEHILAGVERAWQNAYFRARYQENEAARALRLLRERATFVMPAENIRGIAQDEEDDLVLATAVSGSATFLVTGDRKFLQIAAFGETQIITPRAFLELLEIHAPVSPITP